METCGHARTSLGTTTLQQASTSQCCSSTHCQSTQPLAESTTRFFSVNAADSEHLSLTLMRCCVFGGHCVSCCVGFARCFTEKLVVRFMRFLTCSTVQLGGTQDQLTVVLWRFTCDLAEVAGRFATMGIAGRHGAQHCLNGHGCFVAGTTPFTQVGPVFLSLPISSSSRSCAIVLFCQRRNKLQQRKNTQLKQELETTL